MAPSTPIHFCSLLLLLLFLPFLPTVFTYSKDDCYIGQKEQPLLAQQVSNPWKSPSGEFAFGFYPLQNSEKANQFLLVVWFNNIKDQTIVWSANGNKPAPQGSALKQNNNNEFVLNDPQGNELWKAPSNGSKSICVAIMDNGNLVILDENYNSTWESFKEPTDTILTGQILRMPSTLRSRQSEKNYSKGSFRLSLQPDGNLVLYSLSMPSEILEKAYFATMTMYWDS
jgi:hypothetical protein